MPSDVNAYVELTSRRIAELMLVSLETPTMIAHMQGVIAEGGAPVVQLMNTYEADALVDRATVERTLSDLIERIIPVVKVRKASGTKRRVLANYLPIADLDGAPIPVPTNQALRISPLARLPGLPPMPSALEQILNAFGPTTVAEITGRSARVVNTAEGPRCASSAARRPCARSSPRSWPTAAASWSFRSAPAAPARIITPRSTRVTSASATTTFSSPATAPTRRCRA